MKIVFWLVVCGDLAVLLLLFVLGLAAAPSSKTSPLAVAAVMLLVPLLLLGGSIVLFLRAESAVWRGLALVLALSPLLVVVALRGIEEVKLRLNSNSGGTLTFFRAGPMREMAEAIARNDAATVARLAPQVKLNGHGYGGMTLLMSAFRQLRETPDQLDVVRALIQAGADPNVGTDELPLEMAIQISGRSGPEPALLLLAAGANPNARNQFRMPVYFAATGITVPIGVLQAMLAHGADLTAETRPGKNAVLEAATCQNWKAVLLLLEKGADWKRVRTENGLPLKDQLESDLRVYGDTGGLAEVIEYLKRQ